MSFRNRLARWRALPAAERRLLVQAVVLLPACALALRLRGLRGCQPLVRDGAGIRSPSPARVAVLVAMAARALPWRTGCLPASLALQHLLHRDGIGTALRVGVRTVEGRLEAHAWVERDGIVLLDLRDPGAEFRAFDGCIIARGEP